jgi:hypothetical protein
MNRANDDGWYRGTPKKADWYLTGHLNGKPVYRYWLNNAWSEGIIFDSYIDDYKGKGGIQVSPMSAAVSSYKPLFSVPEFLQPFTNLIVLP